MRLYRLLLGLYPARFREEFGGPLEQQFADEYREAGGVSARFVFWLRALRDLAWSIPVELAHELRQDLAHSWRMYSRRPFLMIFTIAILALAIGGVTGVFSVVNAVLLRSLPFRAPDRIVMLSNFGLVGDGSAGFHQWRSANEYLDDAAAFCTTEVNLSGASTPVRVTLAETSFNFFSMLGTDPVAGRAFAPREDVPGNNSIAVISYSLWQQMFGSDPRAIGATIHLNGTPVTVIGVAKPGVDYPSKASVWTPTIFDFRRIPKTGVIWWRTVGRLKDGMTLARAETMFEADAEHHWPTKSIIKLAGKDIGPMKLALTPIQAELAGPVRQASLVLMAATIFVLLIACANVANLLLTRTTERRNELATRAALGASRARLVQQLLSESVLLSLIAGVVGIAVAYWASKIAALAQPAALGAQIYTILDWRVLTFATGLAAFTGILFGVAPSWFVQQLQPAGDVARSYGSGASLGTSKFRGVLIAIQAALTVVLLAGSVTMGRSFLRLLGTDLGFQADHLVTVSVSLAGTKEEHESRMLPYLREALDRLRAVPSVESAGAINYLPLDAKFFQGGKFMTESGRETSLVTFAVATPDYFRAMGTKILYGREFNDSDRAAGERVVIVTEGLARQVAEGSAVIGRKLIYRDSQKTLTIIGVARSVRYMGPENQVSEQVILPATQSVPGFATFVARVRGNASDYLAACRDAVQSVDRDVPVYNAKTFTQRLEETLARPRFHTTIFLFFGGFALLLAIAGIYGAASYSITQRKHEIGVRMAVGASVQGIRAMLLRQGIWPIGLGMIAGLCGALWQSKILQSVLAASDPMDARTCTASAVLLMLAAVAAIWFATQRVIEMNPVEILKSE